jgi:hypothetical protein
LKYLTGLLLVVLVGCGTSAAIQQPALETKTFGERQVEQMLDDRPDMKGIMPPSDPVVKWVIDSFNGKYVGRRIYWNANSPHGGVDAENYRAEDGMSFIAVTGGTESTPVDKWAAAVYELHNIQNEFEPLVNKAMAGDLDEDAFADECMKLELDAIKKTRDFFITNPLPKSVHGRDPWYNSALQMPETYKFEDYKAAIDTPQSPAGHFKYWREYYRSAISPYVRKSDEAKNDERAK